VPAVEPGSFRDRDSRVFTSGDSVLRAISPSGAEDWDLLQESGLLAELMDRGAVVVTREIDSAALSEEAGLLVGGIDRVLEHDRIPFVSYPYEWTFSMLQDAALLELDIALEAIERGLMLKDATPYNVQFNGSLPIFIDLGSFEALPEGRPWVGYRQYCMLFLYPLLFQAHRDLPFQPWLRGSLDGIEPVDAIKVFSLRDRLKPGVFLHASLHARLDRRAKRSGPGSAESNGTGRRVRPGALKAHLESMRKLTARLKWKAGESAWSGYREDNTYSDEDDIAKKEFVDSVVGAERPGLTWDLGCNDGAYSRIADRGPGSVVALDFDHATVEALYRSLREEGNTSILPLVANLADPSPGLGWRGRERRPLEQRGSPDLTLALALVHHVSITANIPIADFLDWLRELSSVLVIEFPKRDDPMVEALLVNREPGANPDYRLEEFERELGRRFTIDRRQELPSGRRTLYVARPAG
jgi:hypothetical protein